MPESGFVYTALINLCQKVVSSSVAIQYTEPRDPSFENLISYIGMHVYV